jgi:hypothetical protein
MSTHAQITAQIVLTTFRKAAGQHGYPASTLTDNGMVYTVRYAGGRGGRNHLEHELRRLHIVQKNSRPNHPATCGKVERFQQTMKKWLRAQPVQPTTIAELQALLDQFIGEYNQHRPHRSCRTARRRPPFTPTAAATPTTESAATRSAKPAASPCASRPPAPHRPRAGGCNDVIVRSDLPPSSGRDPYSPEYLYYVTLHELGHALGLGHSTNLLESTYLMGYGWSINDV